MNTRDALVAGLSRAYSGTADLTTGMALLVDRPDVADRVRPTARRRSGLPEPEDDNPELDPIGDPRPTGDPAPSDGPVPSEDPTGGDPTPS